MTKHTNKVFLGLFVMLPALLVGQTKPAGGPLGARIPAISGQVVDALTGKPVANVDVTLRAVAGTVSLGDGSGESALRYENFRTLAEGRFNFRTSLEAKLTEPFTSMKGYWLSVNRTFLSIESLKAATPYQEVTIDSTTDDLSWEIARDPLQPQRRTSKQQGLFPNGGPVR